MANPFYDDVDDTFRGVRVRVHTSDHTYEGWCGRWHYNEHGVIVYDAERDDDEQVGAVTVSNLETVRCSECASRAVERPLTAPLEKPENCRS